MRKSYGVLLINYDFIRDEYCFLLVQKRTTYGYFELIIGDYKYNEDSIYTKYSELTPCEQIVFSKSFEENVKYARCNDGKREKFNQLKRDFDFPFFKNRKSTLWEIPKGATKRDTPIKTAIRELYEETGAKRKFYKFLPESIKVYRFDENRKYEINYYYAVTKYKLHLDVKDKGEIARARWVYLDEIHNLYGCEEIFKVIDKILPFLRKRQNFIF